MKLESKYLDELQSKWHDVTEQIPGRRESGVGREILTVTLVARAFTATPNAQFNGQLGLGPLAASRLQMPRFPVCDTHICIACS